MFDLNLIGRMLAKHEYDVDWNMKLVAVGPGREAWESQLEEARQAVAEFATLRKRIEAAPITTASSYFGTWCKIKEEGLPDEWNGKRVRLLVEDDDAQA